MVFVDIRIAKDEFTPFMKKFNKSLPIALHKSIRDTAFRAQGNLRREVTNQNLIWEHKLWDQIQARRKSKFQYNVFIPKKGIMLDSMRTHWVSLKPGREITRWAMAKFGKPFKDLPRAIQVKAHPWIQTPLDLTTKQVPQIVQRNLRKVMKK